MSVSEKLRDRSAKICVVGVGYVGLPTALLFAEKGYRVIGADVNPSFVDSLNKGKSYIKDPALDKGVEQAHSAKRLSATTDATAAAKEADAIIVCVPTPSVRNKPDMQYLEASLKSVAKGLDAEKPRLVVTESTTYPGACRSFSKPLLERESGLKCGKDFFLGHCLERLNLSDAAHTVKNTPRVLAGVDEESSKLVEELYKNAVDAQVLRVSSTDVVETVKLVENIQRDVNLAFINEVALICEKIGVDVKEVIEGCRTKWNWYNAWPGAGVGGHCLPNNAYYLTSVAEERGFHARLIPLARSVNDSIPLHVVELVEEGLKQAGLDVKGANIALLGVAYKPDTDDVRQAPSRAVVKELVEKGAYVIIHDPHVSGFRMRMVHDKIAANFKEAVKGRDCIVITCGHSEYKALKAEDMDAKVVVDAALIFDKKEFLERGVIYKRVGLP